VPNPSGAGVPIGQAVDVPRRRPHLRPTLEVIDPLSAERPVVTNLRRTVTNGEVKVCPYPRSIFVEPLQQDPRRSPRVRIPEKRELGAQPRLERPPGQRTPELDLNIPQTRRNIETHLIGDCIQATAVHAWLLTLVANRVADGKTTR
jgi:hypothetical protein